MSVGLEKLERVEDMARTDASSERLCIQSSEGGEQDSFKDLKLASQTILETLQQNGRSKCPKCLSSRMFYCYSCCLLVDGVNSDEIPQVKLPLKIDIIKHPNETDGKSTAVHAKLLARDDVNIYTYPCMPDNEEEKHEVVVVFPGPKSVSFEDLPKHLSKLANEKSALLKHSSKNVRSRDESITLEEPEHKRAKYDHKDQGSSEERDFGQAKTKISPLKRVIFIDSTWNQTNKIITDERLQELLHVELRTRKTCFWRCQKGKPDTYLATIEAIYYFLVDYHQLLLNENYNGEYDNLLFFYSFMYRLINRAKLAAGKLN
ncbi:tRNA-uridine aminocarboxypropyltransferase 1 [Rhincodon typus]|uniref:tRNA-uridine aminocarboxypropyltransferase 1 n=1 Tax=Rhincodon typus TaxID=259920 RepID=UPI0009A36B7F|nr:tRNA-uridine aminocarboxypropyltransferase 1 [Rhincodon typus]XP_020370765.1 tRNA-uridine aminocarboxypropyltransferase 1 [Rhincodon typus]XP_048471879.1 tRNA-uridine aminocarboxypropyltransferase 1 [Rhincodon typus]